MVNSIKHVCLACGRDYFVDGRHRSRPLFCSRACQNNYRQPRARVTRPRTRRRAKTKGVDQPQLV